MRPVSEADVRTAVLSEVAERLEELGLATGEIADDFDLLGEGVIDSFGLLELIGTIEERFDLSIDFEELDAADLAAIGPFSRYVAASSGPAKNGPVDGSAPRPRPPADPGSAPAPISLGVAPPSGPMRRAVGRVGLGAYRRFRRVRRKALSLVWAGSFASFGSNSVIDVPIRLRGESRIAIGSTVFIGSNCWLQVLDGEGEGVALWIGDRVSIAGHCVLSAAASIRIGDAASLARGVYVADHAHAYKDPSRPILDQGITDVRPVEIGDGAWLGENVVVLPGVRIGRGAVISANSVVSRDVPDHALAAGIPAQVLSRFG